MCVDNDKAAAGLMHLSGAVPAAQIPLLLRGHRADKEKKGLENQCTRSPGGC